MMAFLIRYLAALAPMHEFNLDTLACGAGPLAVRVRFIRNEALALSGKGTTAAKRVVFALTTARALVSSNARGGAAFSAGPSTDATCATTATPIPDV